MPSTIPLTADEATVKGYEALTIAYDLPREKRMLSHVLADMQDGKIEHCVVQVENGVEVWRKPSRDFNPS